MITYCPSCKNELYKPQGTAQNIKGCKACGGKFLILETTQPNKRP